MADGRAAFEDLGKYPIIPVDVVHQTEILVHIEAVPFLVLIEMRGNYAGAFLAPMLQCEEAIVRELGSARVSEHPKHCAMTTRFVQLVRT
jgi:hypothetical protein